MSKIIGTLEIDEDIELVEVDLNDQFEELPPIIKIQALRALRDEINIILEDLAAEFAKDLDDAFGPEPQ